MTRQGVFLGIIIAGLLAAGCSSRQPAITPGGATLTQVTAQGEPGEISTPVETPASPTPTPTPGADLPSGQWSARAYNTNDANLILVNDHIVGVAFCCEGDTGWIDISARLEKDANHLTFVNVNSATGARWAFSLTHNDTVVWGDEGESSQPNTLAYVQTLRVTGGGEGAVAVDLRDPGQANLEGAWTAMVQADDVGLLIINGVPVTGGFGEGFGWVEIGDYLYAGQDNIIHGVVWNSRENYSWFMGIRNGETLVWNTESSGSDQTGEVYFTTVIIDGQGNLVGR